MGFDALNNVLPILFHYMRSRNHFGLKGMVFHLLKLEKLYVLLIMAAYPATGHQRQLGERGLYVLYTLNRTGGPILPTFSSLSWEAGWEVGPFHQDVAFSPGPPPPSPHPLQLSICNDWQRG